MQKYISFENKNHQINATGGHEMITMTTMAMHAFHLDE